MNWINAYTIKPVTTGFWYKQTLYEVHFEDTMLFQCYDRDTALSFQLKLNGAYNMGFQKGLVWLKDF